jgi:hypothetical protein
MQSERRFSVPTVEVRHYPIGGDPIPVDSVQQVLESQEAPPAEQSSSMGEFARVEILRMGSEIPARVELLLEWARRQANNAVRAFFA